MRRFGALSKTEKISAQGRITIPAPYRVYADLKSGEEVIVVGCEIGVEIWNAKRWAAELDMMNDHFREKGEREMSTDLLCDNEDEGKF
jgi:DNA-binding transcriptional regulator/RsmH inhibitor MraZ